jgi:hypothetical protein
MNRQKSAVVAATRRAARLQAAAFPVTERRRVCRGLFSVRRRALFVKAAAFSIMTTREQQEERLQKISVQLITAQLLGNAATLSDAIPLTVRGICKARVA